MRMYPYPARYGVEKLREFSTRVIRQMGRNGLRRIHVVLHATGTMPTVDELEAWIAEHHPRARQDFGVEKAQRMAFSAAVFALGAFDPAEHAKRVERARNGGKASRRGKTFTAAQLAAVASLSIRDQAAALGCSEATISRRRREQNAAEFDTLLAAMDAPEQREEAATSDRETKAAPAPIDIRTRRSVEPAASPVDPILAALEEELRETAANPYLHIHEYVMAVG